MGSSLREKTGFLESVRSRYLGGGKVDTVHIETQPLEPERAPDEQVDRGTGNTGIAADNTEASYMAVVPED